MPEIVARGRTIHYADSKGEEPALVLVHSSGLDNRQWGPLRLDFPGKNRILAPNLLGYGRSGPWPGPAPFTLADDVAVVSAVLDLAEEPVVLVGHSYGGYVAMSAAIEAPERVRAILVHEPVLWGVFYELGDDEAIAEVERANEDGGLLSPEIGGTEPWWRRFVEFWGGEGAWDALPPERRNAFLAVGPKVFEEVRALCLDRTTTRTWSALEMPVVVTVGRGTHPREAEVCRHLAGALDDCRLVEISGGHMAPLTAPAEFSAVSSTLLSRVQTPIARP